MQTSTDVLIIGSGLAGLALALKVAPLARVTILSKADLPQTNTSMAQGGIAAVYDKDDSYEQHVNDTLIAGAGLCKRDVVEQIIRQAPARVADLVNWGVRFDPHLHREGGHLARRIFHFADQTGAEIQNQVLSRVLQDKRIKVLANHLAVELITNHRTDPWEVNTHRCEGAFVLTPDGEVKPFLAKATILATGGAGKVYLYTSNWSGATGDGIAMAHRAGARVANLEFMQFHPTCLYHPQARNFLISEALRGEGGVLRNRLGQDFMAPYHPLGSLAPRDIVARSIDAEMKKSGDPCVYLDMTHLPAEFLRAHFPAIYKKCLEYGIDLTKEPIPVVPAAHYLCGGVVANVNGQTDLSGLYAIGETACTGFHGANRLASNSLLECVAMAHNCAEDLRARLPHWPKPTSKPLIWTNEVKPEANELVIVTHAWDEIRRLMWNYVGIVRSSLRLERARVRLQNILREVADFEDRFRVHPHIVELRNLAIVASLTVECAIKRKESLGIHYLEEPSRYEEPPPPPLGKRNINEAPI